MKKSRSTTKTSEATFPSLLNRFTLSVLRRHHLLDQSAKDLVTICRDVCGVQAQIMSAAQLQLWARNHAITPAMVNDALWKTRSLVKTSLMRQTLHLVPADEFPLYIAAHKSARAKAVLSIMARCKITRDEADALSALILEELKAGPAPRAAITAAVRPKVSKRLRVWMDKVWSIVRLPVIEGHGLLRPRRRQPGNIYPHRALAAGPDPRSKSMQCRRKKNCSANTCARTVRQRFMISPTGLSSPWRKCGRCGR